MSGAGAEGGAVWPLDDDEHRAQIGGLRSLLGDASTVVDLGAGDGRVAVELASMGHRVIAVDRNEAALARIEDRRVERWACDFLDARAPLVPDGVRGADAVVCLGHTLMLVTDVPAAVGVLGRVASLLRGGGMIVIDDVPALLVELTEGNWQSGFSEDGRQMVWEDRDLVFAVRAPAAGDPSSWRPRAGDERCRVWTLGELELLGMACGFGRPEVIDGANLVVMRRQPG